MLQNYYHLCLGFFTPCGRVRSFGCCWSAAVSWLECALLRRTGTPPGAHSGPASVTRHSAHKMGAAERVVADEQS